MACCLRGLCLWLGMVCLAALCLPVLAHGTVTPSGGATVSWYGLNASPGPAAPTGVPTGVDGGNRWYTSKAAACAALTDLEARTFLGQLGSDRVSDSRVYDGSSWCVVHIVSVPAGSFAFNQNIGYVTTTAPGPLTCPSNSTGSSSCTCSAGFKPNGGATACVAIGSCDAVIKDAVSGWAPNNYLVVPNMDVVQCHAGCEVRAAFVVGNQGAYYMADPQATGAYCQGTANSGTTVTQVWPTPVPPGKCPGTVNGVAVVVDCSDSQTGTKIDTTKPDGATEKTDSKTTCVSGQGCTTTTTTVACSASGVCNTTSTVTRGADTNAGGNTGAAGGGGGAGADDPCTANPGRAGCAELGTAQADAVTTVNRTVAITPDSGWAHDSTCPADKVLHLAHVTVTVPFTLLCTAADMAHPIVVAVAWLSSIGGFLGLARKGSA